MPPDLGDRVIRLLQGHPGVLNAWLVGSRAEGRATPLSDWDFRVDIADFNGVAQDLPALLAPLAPIAEQWDRLSSHQCWMLMLPGPVKVDVIFADEPHEPEPPWVASAASLGPMDRHFWDWMLWLGGKQTAGKNDVVAQELRTLHDHLLEPLGVTRPPTSIAEAIDAYREAREQAERRFAVRVPRRLESAVAAAVAERATGL